MKTFRKFLLLFAILITLVSIDVTGYKLLSEASFVDALYMTVISITTVGFGEVFPLSPNAKLFTIWVIISGLGVFFYIVTAIVEIVFEGNIRRILGRRKMKSILKLKDHMIIAGFGIMGEHVCKELEKVKIKFVVLENDNERFVVAEAKGYNAILGNATEEDFLMQAGVEKAGVFISLLGTDAENIFTVMSAREINPSLFIITRAMEAVNKKKFFKIGANRVITPYELSSRRIVNTALRPNVVELIDVMTHSRNISLSIEEITVSGDSDFSGKEIRNSGLRENYNAIIIAIKRGEEMFFNPSPTLEIQEGDILILVGEKDVLVTIH
ncbi:MAG: potassium channel protein [bacterium]|nr:potassium channel protein [bacterium]